MVDSLNDRLDEAGGLSSQQVSVHNVYVYCIYIYIYSSMFMYNGWNKGLSFGLSAL